MSLSNTSTTVKYTDAELHTLVEEYLVQQKDTFTLQGVCSYVLYWAVEDGKVTVTNVLQPSDQDRVKLVLASIVRDGRIAVIPGEEISYKRVIF